MAQNSHVVLEGILKPDGTLELDGRPALPPGRVRVSLQSITSATREHLPDPPWPDESIPAPFDLPLASKSKPVEPVKVAELLPEPFEWTEDDARP